MSDIVKRYLKITVFIVVVLIIMNVIFVKIWADYTDSEEPIETSHFLNGIKISENNCSVNEGSKRFIKENFKWVMVLNNMGEVVFSYNLPDKLNRNYSIGEIADYANWYIDGYPVKMVNAPNGLVIMGNEQGSLWRRNVSIKINNGIVIVIAFVVLNILVTVVLSYVLSKLFMRDLRHIIEGIFDVSEDKEVKLDEKGYLKEILKAVNSVSKKITKQKEIIQRNDEMKKEWLVGVSHDIKTPLSVIVGNTEELQSIEIDEKKNHQLEVIKKQSFKIKYLVNDLNLISKLDNNIFEINAQTIDIYRLLRECIADVMNMYGQEKYEFRLDNELSKTKIYVQADEHLLKRAFGNILINSILHNNEGCKISISIQICDFDIYISFEDDGIGISEEKMMELNGDGERDINKVHGWGTIVVKRIIELHNGKTKFSKANQGMHVSITLPLKS